MGLPPLNAGLQDTVTVLSFTSLVDTLGGVGRPVGMYKQRVEGSATLSQSCVITSLMEF